MKSAFFVAAALAAGVSAQLQIDTPTPGAAQCEPQQITFSGGTREYHPPWFFPSPTHSPTSPLLRLVRTLLVRILALLSFPSIQNNPISTTPFLDFGQQNTSPITWVVNGTLGQSLIFQIKDSTGASQSSAPFSIITGVGDTCINNGGGGTPPSTTGSSPGVSTTGPASTGATGPTSPTTPASTKQSGTSSAAKSSGSATNTANAATAVAFPAGVLPACVAVLGAAMIALLA
ncbi:hypothetical protein C8F01DRAFT_1247382 [Mycena amicta]|nr:hypothetical protein C8F01DRAFT_1247382 [Mycena amicta]